MKKFNQKLLFTNQPKAFSLNVSNITISRILLTKSKVSLALPSSKEGPQFFGGVLGLCRNYSTTVPLGALVPKVASEVQKIKSSFATVFDFKSDLNINLTP
jgi:hypothetical protein